MRLIERVVGLVVLAAVALLILAYVLPKVFWYLVGIVLLVVVARTVWLFGERWR
jgi:hypothetical protein